MTHPTAELRIPPGGRRELGLLGWLFCKFAAKVWGIPEFHLFTVLAQHRRMFWTWGSFSGYLLNFGRLSKHDTEVAILRTAHLPVLPSGIRQRCAHRKHCVFLPSVGSQSTARFRRFSSAIGCTP